MEIHVKLYGPLSLMVGKRSFMMKIDQVNVDVKDFITILGLRIPQFRRCLNDTNIEEILKQKILLIINDEPCACAAKIIKDGDKIQILTPIKGG